LSLFNELKRRNVFRVGIAYVLMGWGLLQAADFALALVIAIMGIEQFVSIDKSAPTNPSAGGEFLPFQSLFCPSST
jgi:hypothetical protein